MVTALVLVSIACSEARTPAGPTGTPGPISSYASLMTALRSTGATVDSGALVSQPFLSGAGRVMRVNGGDVQVFEYASASGAEADAVRINSDGSGTATVLVTWIAPPHFYRSGPVIALYVGSQPEVKQPLESVLGSQFAGR